MLFVLVSRRIEHPSYLKVREEREETESGVELFKCVGALKSAETSRSLVM
jgi:hypothetical protein